MTRLLSLRRFIPAAVFVGVIVASLIAASVAYRSAEEAAQIRFEAMADDALARIEARLELHRALLRSTLAFVEARDRLPDRDEFTRFVEGLNIATRYSGVRGIGVARLIETGQEATIASELARNYQLDRSVWPDATDQPLRTPIVLLEPIDDRNRVALGYDMFAEPVRRAAMVKAMETGEPQASGLVRLVQEGTAKDHPGFLLYMPARNRAMIGPDGRPRAGAADGFVYAPFRAADLFNAALGRVPVLPLAITIHDDGEGEAGAILFQSEIAAAERWAGLVETTRRIEFSGRLWRIEFRPGADFEAPSSLVLPIALGVLGVLLAAAIAFVARYQELAFRNASILQEAAEASLVEKDLMLSEMKHRIKNSITRVLAIARQTAANAGSLPEFSQSFGARMQAMAASQDMLTRSRWQKADLTELLATELEQVFGKDREGFVLGGPSVLLNEATTQALGLTFHELATNALKYGDATQSNALSVTWRVERAKDQAWLRLTWSETGGTAVKRPEKTGFGTKLIDMAIVRELGGGVERHYHDQGIRIEIGIPLKP